MQLATHSQWLTASDRRGSGFLSKQDLPPEMPGQAGQTGAQARKWVLCLRAHGLLLIPPSPKLPRQSLPVTSVHLDALLALVRGSRGVFYILTSDQNAFRTLNRRTKHISSGICTHLHQYFLNNR